jgi:hypothetical protein
VHFNPENVSLLVLVFQILDKHHGKVGPWHLSGPQTRTHEVLVCAILVTSAALLSHTAIVSGTAVI